MNCTELDRVVVSLTEGVTRDDTAFGVAVTLLLATSLVLLTHGERLIRPLAGLLGGVAGGGGAFVLTRLFRPALPCEVRLILAGVSGVVVAVVAICILKTGLFLIGAFGLGSVAHLVWDSLPLGHVRGPFTLLSRPGWYYIAVGSTALVGAVVSQWKRRTFTRIASAVLGGTGLATGVHLLYARNDSTAPPLLLLCVLIGSSVAGCVTQHALETWRRKRRAAKRRTEQELVPVGRPVE